MKSIRPFDLSFILNTKRHLVGSPKQYTIFLRVYSRLEKKYSLISTKLSADKKLFEEATSKKPRTERALEIQAILEKIKEEAKLYNKQHIATTLDQFKVLFKGKKGSVKVIDGYNNLINWNLDLRRYGSAESATYSKKKIAEFTNINKLTYNDITVNWLMKFEVYCKDNGISTATVGFYLRQLRKVLNLAIENPGIDYTKDRYPFSKGKYQIKVADRRHASLDAKQLKRFYEWVPTKENLGLAKDFFFFSYFANGLNPADILNIKHSDRDGDKFHIVRQKTKTQKQKQKKITVYLTPPLLNILKRRKGKGNYLWGYYNNNDTEDVKKRRRNYFVKHINSLLKEIAVILDFPKKISTTWARHSMATSSIRKGSSIEAVSQAMGHSSVRVTEGYFAGFEDSVQKELQERLTDF